MIPGRPFGASSHRKSLHKHTTHCPKERNSIVIIVPVWLPARLCENAASFHSLHCEWSLSSLNCVSSEICPRSDTTNKAPINQSPKKDESIFALQLVIARQVFAFSFFSSIAIKVGKTAVILIGLLPSQIKLSLLYEHCSCDQVSHICYMQLQFKQKNYICHGLLTS